MKSVTQQLWVDFSDQLKGFIFKKVKNESAADDILQEVFLKIIEHEDKITQAKNMQQYLFGIARNTTVDFFRKTENTNDIKEEILPFTEEESASLNATIAQGCMLPFINQLPEKYKYALTKTELEHQSQKELAEELNISYSGAKSRVQRGKEKLKDLILACCNFQSDKYGNLKLPEDENCTCD